MVEVLDLRDRGPGCTERPLVIINKKLREGYSELKIIVKHSDAPRVVLEILLRKLGYSIKDYEDHGEYYEVYVTKNT
ncbi:hypothetical protein [Staphylothermus marinus]|uniref:hypothetical protein n=1 Tax=Staphylothermus marinus TaxID=2280 RepID=UPI00032599BF|nr:hypothetical protein [Staphylothermus marinus]